MVVLFDAVGSVVPRPQSEETLPTNTSLLPDAWSKFVDYGKAEAFRGEPLVPFEGARRARRIGLLIVQIGNRANLKGPPHGAASAVPFCAGKHPAIEHRRRVETRRK
jgi:hypothetical protein